MGSWAERQIPDASLTNTHSKEWRERGKSLPLNAQAPQGEDHCTRRGFEVIRIIDFFFSSSRFSLCVSFGPTNRCRWTALPASTKTKGKGRIFQISVMLGLARFSASSYQCEVGLEPTVAVNRRDSLPSRGLSSAGIKVSSSGSDCQAELLSLRLAKGGPSRSTSASINCRGPMAVGV